MKSIIFLMMVLGAMSSWGQDKITGTEAEQKPSPIQMHEQMAKAHQQAADCLKSGKSEEECRSAFHDMCKGAGGPGKCDGWMMHHKMGRKGK